MSNLSATVLYNYTAQNSTELHVTANETLYIINRKEENGFSKVRNENGDEGLVPANIYKFKRSSNDSKDDNVPKNEKKENYEEDYNTSKVIGKNSGNNLQRANLLLEETVKYGTVRFKNKNIYGEIEIATNIEAKVEIIKDESNEISQWKPLGEFHKCQIESYGVDSKGITNFITYQLNSSYSNGLIKRRYNQFDWLYKQLSDKYPCIIIPPLPAKQAVGRFKNDFIEERKIRLQKWLNHITEHPVLSYSNMVKLFLSEPDKDNWRNGKRLTEKDVFKNGRFYSAVVAPTDGIDWKSYSKCNERVSSFIENFERNSFALQESYNRFHKKQSINICNEYEKIGTAIENLSKSLSFDPYNYKNTIDLTHGLQNIGQVYKNIGKLFKNQAKIDRDLVEINLEEINNITKEIPSLIELASCAMNTMESVSKKNSDSKCTSEFVETIDKSVQVIARTVDAELNWLKDRRENQLRSTMSQYLNNQIQLFTQITEILKESLSHI